MNEIRIKAQVIELEQQRNILATRSAEMAGEIAVLENLVAEKDANIAALQKEVEELKSNKE